jgi:hypothetical protein
MSNNPPGLVFSTEKFLSGCPPDDDEGEEDAAEDNGNF